jgi:hypothetical protein
MHWHLTRAYHRREKMWTGSVDGVEVAWVEVYQGDATQPTFFWSVMVGQFEAIGWDTSLAAAQRHARELVYEHSQMLMVDADAGEVAN